MNKVGILYQAKLASAKPLAEEIERKLKAGRVAETWLASAWDELDVTSKAPGSDMIITLGGDGTILRAARVAAPLNVPVWAVNLGRLGFMTESSPDEVFTQLTYFLEGQAWVEERLMLHAGLQTATKSLMAKSADGPVLVESCDSFHALNDVVVARGDRVRVIYVDVTIDGEKGPSYVADGVIVATPTGSTGYSLSGGGPILHPELQSVVITPIAPHFGASRTLVLPASAQVELHVSTDHSAVMSIDGQVDVPVQSGDVVKVAKSPYVTRLLRVQPRTYFYRALAARLR